MKAFKRVLVLFISSFILMPVTFAKTTTTTTTVPVTTTTTTAVTTDSREELVGNVVNYDKDLSRTSFSAGNIVTFKSKVDGLSFVAGNTVNVSGQSDYSFIAGNNITITGLKTKDLFAAGSILTINEVEARDMYVAGAEITINGNGNSVYVAGEKITLKGNFTNVSVDAEEFILDGTITGTLKLNDDAKTTMDETQIGNLEKYKSNKVDIDTEKAGKIVAKGVIAGLIISAIIKFVSLLVAGIIFIAVCKKTTTAIENTPNTFGYIAARFGIGFAVLIIMPILSLVVMFTGVGALLGGIMLLMYVLMILLSSIISALYFAKMAFAKLNNYVRFLLMALIIGIIKIVPIVGGLVGFVLLCVGIGVLLNALFSFRKEK